MYRSQKKIFISILTFFSLTVFAANLTGKSNDIVFTPGDHNLSFKHGERVRYYLLHLPINYDPQQSLPLLIILHGENANADNAARMTGMSEKADKEGFIAVYPQGAGRFRKHALSWNAANCCGYAYDTEIDDVGFIEQLIDTLVLQYNADPRRVFIAGFSNGGMMAFKLACILSKKITAFAVVAGVFNDLNCEPESPVSLIMLHGTLDHNIPFDGGFGNELNGDRIDSSVPAAITFWVRHNKCNYDSSIESKDKVVKEVFSGGQDSTSVILYTIQGIGHAWPGGKKSYLFPDEPGDRISATDAIWDFFRNHPSK